MDTATNPDKAAETIKYRYRSCARCGARLEIVIPRLGSNLSARAINGECTSCGHRLIWFVFLGKRPPRPRRQRFSLPLTDGA